MILIQEQCTKKVPGDYSFQVEFSFNQALVDLLKSLSGSVYDKHSKTWELPSNYLAEFLDRASMVDTIELQLLSVRGEKEPQVKLDQCYRTTPYSYQLDGIKYGVSHRNWLLLDSMGLGKTLQILYIAEELHRKNLVNHCLIVCGVNSLKFNWLKEIKKHSYLSGTILGSRINRSGKYVVGSIKDRVEHLKENIDEFFVITNIESLRDEDIIKTIQKGPNCFDMVVCDEIHRAKSPSTAQSQGLLKLKKAPYKIGATGTLLLNNPLDAYTSLHWIGVEKSTYTTYKNFYCVYGGPFHNILTGFKNLNTLKNQISKCSLRRTKDILDLPPKTIVNEYVEMDSAQQHLYQDVVKGIRDQIDKVKLSAANTLGLVTRLRQATACPSILTTEKIDSAKINRAIELVEDIVAEGNKVVVFSTFKESVYVLQEKLKEFNPVIGTGDLKDEVISSNVDIFQSDPDKKVFIGTWQKTGTGLTLTAANYVIFIDVPYTDGAYQQAQDRCYRIGTSKNVTIYHLITLRTIDERVLEIVEDKEALSDFILDNVITDKGLKSLQKFIEDL